MKTGGRPSRPEKERRSLSREGLVDKFLDSVRVFEEKTEGQFRILSLTMMWTGGFDRYITRPPKTDERFEDWEKEFVTMDNARSYLGFLIKAMSVKEDFLVSSLMVAVDHFLESLTSEFPPELERRKQYRKIVKQSSKGTRRQEAISFWQEATENLRRKLMLLS